jgi:hypothetical protein
MLKPQMPNIPGVGAVSDTLDFVKNLWGSMSVPGLSLPGMAAPTMSVDDLDKKIADLKAVEAWLAVNSSMLRGTIQALEVQRGTIATLKSMGATLAQAVKQPGANEKSVLAAAPYASAFFAQPAETPAPPPAKAEETPALLKPAKKVDGNKPTAADASAAAAAVQMANPSAWWNMLQDQFKQAVSTAMSSDKMAGASALAQDAASKLVKAAVKPMAAKAPAKAPARKPAAKKAARPRAAAKPKE